MTDPRILKLRERAASFIREWIDVPPSNPEGAFKALYELVLEVAMTSGHEAVREEHEAFKAFLNMRSTMNERDHRP